MKWIKLNCFSSNNLILQIDGQFENLLTESMDKKPSFQNRQEGWKPKTKAK